MKTTHFHFLTPQLNYSSKIAALQCALHSKRIFLASACWKAFLDECLTDCLMEQYQKAE